jgi:hypothetical protein
VLDRILPIERVVDVQRRAARITEDVFDAFVFQAAGKDFCASQFHGEILSKETEIKKARKRASSVEK